MKPDRSLRFVNRVIRILASVAIFTGSYWLIVWFSGRVTDMSSKWITMDKIIVKTNMALGLLLAGVVLFLIMLKTTKRSQKLITTIISVIVFAIGILTLSEHIFKFDLGIDQLLGKEIPGAIGTESPNWMGLPGSLSLILLGSGFLIHIWYRGVLAVYLGFVVCMINLVPAVGYFLSIDELYSLPELTGIAWPTVLALISLGLGLAFSENNHRLILILRSNPGGLLLRRFIPVILFVPPVLAFLLAKGERSGFYDALAGTGILVVTMVFFLLIMVFNTARTLNRFDIARRSAEEALRESENKYKELVENARSIILKMDKTGRFTFFNEFAQKFFGYSEEEIIGKTATETILPEKESTGKDLVEFANDLYQDPDKYSISINENIKKNGERVWVEWHNKSLFDKTGNRTGHIAVGIDITERKRSEEALKAAREKLDISLENGNIGLWEWNLKTNVVIWDERMEKMFGLDPGSFDRSYSSFEKLVHEEDLSHLRKAINESLTRDLPFETVYRIKPDNLKTKYISAKGLVKNDIHGKPVSMAGACSDVTGLKEETDQLIIELNEELLRSNKELESFAYVASHDLQEPLRTVSSFTQLLSRQYRDKLDEKAQEYIDFAVDGSKRMYELLNGLLAYSRIHSRDRSFTRVDLNNVLEVVSKNLSLVIREREAIIKAEKLPVVFADENQMIQLFQNIIANGIKFSPDPPSIFISVKSKKSEFLFLIRDEGIGIEPQYFNRIFQIFQRLMPRDKYEGTGIGLAICKRIVELHDGKIWVESQPGKGSSFFFTIPKNRI